MAGKVGYKFDVLVLDRQLLRIRRKEARENAIAEEASKSLEAENWAVEEAGNVGKIVFLTGFYRFWPFDS